MSDNFEKLFNKLEQFEPSEKLRANILARIDFEKRPRADRHERMSRKVKRYHVAVTRWRVVERRDVRYLRVREK